MGAAQAHHDATPEQQQPLQPITCDWILRPLAMALIDSLPESMRGQMEAALSQLLARFIPVTLNSTGSHGLLKPQLAWVYAELHRQQTHRMEESVYSCQTTAKSTDSHVISL